MTAPDKCPKCGASLIASCDNIFECLSANYDGGSFRQSTPCRIRQLERLVEEGWKEGHAAGQQDAGISQRYCDEFTDSQTYRKMKGIQ